MMYLLGDEMVPLRTTVTSCFGFWACWRICSGARCFLAYVMNVLIVVLSMALAPRAKQGPHQILKGLTFCLARHLPAPCYRCSIFESPHGKAVKKSYMLDRTYRPDTLLEERRRQDILPRLQPPRAWWFAGISRALHWLYSTTTPQTHRRWLVR